jgi:hypothetical protein
MKSKWIVKIATRLLFDNGSNHKIDSYFLNCIDLKRHPMSLANYLENSADHHNNVDLLKKTWLQIEKDLGLHDKKLDFNGNPNTAFEELVNHAKNELEQIFNTRGEYLYALMYRADVSEKRMGAIIKDGLDVNAKLASLLVEREFQKVLTREYYKSQSNH